MKDQQFVCGDADALVTYLYDECDDRERALIDAHLVSCASCAEEVATLRGTRTLLASWTPPAAALGFQITRVQDDGAADSHRAEPSPARVLKPARPFAQVPSPVEGRLLDTAQGVSPVEGRWWAKPLPAWAQVAAAAAIFISGVGIGTWHRGPSADVAPAPHAVIAQQPIAAVSAPTVSPADLERVEARLRGEIAQLRTAATAPAGRSSSDDVLRQVKTMIAESERRQQQASALRTAQVVGQLEEQRRVDIAQIQRAVGDVQRIAGATYQDQNRLVRMLVNSQQR
jgi:hypothetical protein